MGATLFACVGGRLTLSDREQLLVSRENGGNLVVLPPRPVWERSELTAAELTAWSFLVASAGRAMLDALPQLAGGCINYWEAGNWALNDRAAPAGPKRVEEHRRVHLHLLGRSRSSASPDWRWGESPRFPDFAARHDWADGFERLRPDECGAIVVQTASLLKTRYGLQAHEIEPWAACRRCAYPTSMAAPPVGETLCDACRGV